MCAIWTDAHPILKMAGNTQYQIFLAEILLSKNPGVLIKMPKKEGITSKEPIKYQLLRLPQGRVSLSESTPTIGVVMPSVTWPDSSAAPVIF